MLLQASELKHPKHTTHHTKIVGGFLFSPTSRKGTGRNHSCIRKNPKSLLDEHESNPKRRIMRRTNNTIPMRNARKSTYTTQKTIQHLPTANATYIIHTRYARISIEYYSVPAKYTQIVTLKNPILGFEHINLKCCLKFCVNGMCQQGKERKWKEMKGDEMKGEETKGSFFTTQKSDTHTLISDVQCRLPQKVGGFGQIQIH